MQFTSIFFYLPVLSTCGTIPSTRWWCRLIPVIADWCGIIGLIFSVIIWIKTKDLKEQINFYKRNQKTIVSKLKSYRESIIRDGLYTLHIRSLIRTELYSILQDYRALLSPWVKFKIYWTLHLLNAGKPDPNLEKLCALLDWIIARIQRKENR